MRRNEAARTLGVLLACAGTVARADDLPPLRPPALAGPSSDAASELPPVIEAPPRPSNREAPPQPEVRSVPPRPANRAVPTEPEGRSILVTPGVPVRGRVTPRPRLPQLEPAEAGPSSSGVAPELFGPEGMTEGPTPRLAPGSNPDPVVRSAPGLAQPGRPLSLEPVPASEVPGASPAPGRPQPRVPSPTPVPATAPMVPRRPSNFFGRLLPPPPSPGRGATGARAATDPSRSPSTEPSPDPAADAALKRRIEHEVREAVGNRVRSVEVRVVGRRVAIRARAARFWQRRGVRRALETLPGLDGYQVTIEVDD